jgi:hypothetical protein
MQTTATPYTPSFLRSSLLAVLAITALLLSANSVFAQAKSVVPASITSLSQTRPTVAGVPTLLTVTGIGNCKYRVAYTGQDASLAGQTQWTFSSTPQNPFPMRLKLLDATPLGAYTWVVTGIEACTGSQRLSFTVQ